jgi:hypothetical protein
MNNDNKNNENTHGWSPFLNPFIKGEPLIPATDAYALGYEAGLRSEQPFEYMVYQWRSADKLKFIHGVNDAKDHLAGILESGQTFLAEPKPINKQERCLKESAPDVAIAVLKQAQEENKQSSTITSTDANGWEHPKLKRRETLPPGVGYYVSPPSGKVIVSLSPNTAQAYDDYCNGVGFTDNDPEEVISVSSSSSDSESPQTCATFSFGKEPRVHLSTQTTPAKVEEVKVEEPDMSCDGKFICFILVCIYNTIYIFVVQKLCLSSRKLSKMMKTKKKVSLYLYMYI